MNIKKNQGYLDFCKKQEMEYPALFAFWKGFKKRGILQFGLFLVHEVIVLCVIHKPAALLFLILSALIMVEIYQPTKALEFNINALALCGIFSFIANGFQMAAATAFFTKPLMWDFWIFLLFCYETLLPVYLIYMAVWIQKSTNKKMIKALYLIQRERMDFIRKQAEDKKMKKAQ